MNARHLRYEPNLEIEQLFFYHAQLTALNRILNQHRHRGNRRVHTELRFFVMYRNNLRAIVRLGGDRYTATGRRLVHYLISLLR
ncbi:unnamed protein product [Caenorhabditis brenneri]